ncbi:MAG: TonB-dependent receptor [Alistipes sp.]
MRHLLRLSLLLTLATTPCAADNFSATADAGIEAVDTVIVVDKVQVTAIKQGLVLRSQPLSATIVGSRAIERGHVDALKDLSQSVPNFHAPDYGSRMTSSIYVRGLGARIDQPVMGLNIDNVPVLNKGNFDMELADAERIEVLRGPQSTLYGRNTMGGVINVYTLSPLSYEGVRLGMEYSSGNSYRFRASSYYKIAPDLGMAVTGYYTHTGGLFENQATGEKCDWERLGGGRWKMQWRSKSGLRIDNTLSISVLDQGGYPYAYIGKEIIRDGQSVIRPGQIAYNDPCTYRRTTVSDGLTVRYDAEKFSVSSITSYQYSDDEMILDQDFLPLSYFTLRQATKEHSATEDVVISSHTGKDYRWLFGAFGFYRHGKMNAPVNFKQVGIDELIFANANTGSGSGVVYSKASDEQLLESTFRIPTYGAALYHESNYTLGHWLFTAGLRVDYERTQLHYHSRAKMDYFVSVEQAAPVLGHIAIDNRNSLAHNYVEVLPKAAVTYRFNEKDMLYLSATKGYKAGGFNTQIFSDILQEKIKWQMASGLDYKETDIMSYKPEYSWNYEVGGHFSCMEGDVRGDFALFWIDCHDQQLTVFPSEQSTGRMMTNAGRTRSLGAELSLQITPWRNLDLNIAYGYTHATFVRYNDGKQDYRGNFIPYAPQHTLAAGGAWTIPTGVSWLGNLIVHAGVRCAGRIYWNESNSLSQPFYALLDASLRLEQPHYALDFWGRNLGGEGYDVFYFKSIGNEFVQRGRPRTFGITLTIKL